MRSNTRTWLSMIAAMALLSMVTSGASWARRLSEAKLFIELNDTDGDVGIQIFLDAEGWDRMQILDPQGRVIVNIGASQSAQIQGLTEAFFESAEPSFDEQTLDEFLALWPEGTYKFRGRTKDGEPLRGKAELTHALPDAPVLIRPAEDEVVDPNAAVVIEWAPVPDPPGSSIVSYEVIVESDEQDFSIILGPTATTLTLPPEYVRPGTEYKFEVLAKEAGGNQTISEREFATADGE